MTDIKKLIAVLSKDGFDGALITSEINQRYISDFPFTDGYVLVTQKEAFLLADARYIEAARTEVGELTVLLLKGTDTLRKLISDLGLSRIAVEEKELSISDFERLRDAFAPCQLLCGASRLLDGLRAIKSPAELARIGEAQKLTDAAFEHILGYISPSRTEKEIALELEFFMRRMGAEGVSFETIAVSGSASSLPHGTPRDIPLCHGFLTMDFGAVYKGYCSDMTRTVVIGRADEELRLIYDTVLSAQATALEGIRSGLACRDADELARKVIRNGGFGECFCHSLGHGVGMYIHEAPNLSPRSEAILQCGNVVTVEPGIYIAGRHGCRIEDMVAINDSGGILNFTRSTKELIEII